MRILFLNLPFKYKISRASRWPEKSKSGTLYYPYWLAYATGVAKQAGFDISLIDAIAKNLSFNQTIQEIVATRPDLLVAELSTPTVSSDLAFFALCRENGFKGKIVVAGNHASVFTKELLEKSSDIDFVAFGEYDYTIIDLAKNFISPYKVPGIAWRENGKIVINQHRAFICNLDDIPFVSKVYKEYLDFNDYFYSLARHPMIQVLSSRGCPFNCSFCFTPQTAGGHSFRTRSVDNFVYELEYISQELPQIKEVFIEDDTFTVDKKRVQAICEEIIRKKIKLCWSANVRADVDYETLKLMKSAGCRLVVVGYESGNQKILDGVEKKITLKDSIDFANNTKRVDLKVFGCFMIGLPGETKDTIHETYEFAKKLEPDMVFFQQAVPFPGTKFYNLAKENGFLVSENFDKWFNTQGQLTTLVKYENLSAEYLEKVRDKLMIKYYLSFKYIFNTLLRNRDINEMYRVLLGGMNYFLYLLGRRIPFFNRRDENERV
ncbi:magnesium-protoporphyrin IX monomethyl ester oxidative cyclase [candidate division WOR-1 bacterium RIFOXYA2_FULL_36_21]|uniref:Magnesium-protoporphyrin IX monomethyl ester oxidative cyclase n=1 Tax=candidate division WOR-1 bacterium RIFOXYB2_FULL_36_35 TaxID=1802578 RepID=A0A1F4S886_UNCSA|nr:MAG: magnesium-protoporphyrin IX monomethyl ester oxidative cyclase [candidate division WOR-1 bacterium RIFOXYA2_FULL_36_21]OGC14615.1 MAG: magnesium-protoporphyrin IX monomethyl ester oxidative cyclase [candidate division WOR-1 bacterium RIFOXYA12_FULL_36_13]OGC16630.1 MAG: magnesium-protoporphyrin IX monomethyl ester oxidative cyclase [candidate division WOR-1 bacterium RIFOXYB2_FULL_36_35]